MSITILLTDDEQLNRKLFRAILEPAGYKVIEAEGSEQGIQLARENVPDLILMDVQMPGMDGIEALKILKSDPSTQGIPVIAFTFHDSTEYREKLLKHGFNGFLLKSVSTREILNAIKSFLN